MSMPRDHVDCMTCYMRLRAELGRGIGASSVTYTSYGARAYLPPLASNTLLVPSRLAFLQRSASGTVLRYALRYSCLCVSLSVSLHVLLSLSVCVCL